MEVSPYDLNQAILLETNYVKKIVRTDLDDDYYVMMDFDKLSFIQINKKDKSR